MNKALDMTRNNDCKAIEEMLDTVRIEAVGWAWAKACVLLDKGVDPRQYAQDQLIVEARTDLSSP